MPRSKIAFSNMQTAAYNNDPGMQQFDTNGLFSKE